MCDCKEKIMLFEPEYAMQAWESWCPTHGYDNDCYICNIHPTYFSTEKCRKHELMCKDCTTEEYMELIK